MELLTAAQMRAIEAEAIESGRVTGLELMERAGEGVVEAIFAHWPDLGGVAAPDRGAGPSGSAESGRPSEARTRRAVVVCGPGNNGGDGFVVARLLHALGWAVEVHLHGDPAKLPPDAKANCDRWCEISDVRPAAELADGNRSGDPDGDMPGLGLFVDAGFGTGLTRALPPLLARIARMLHHGERSAERQPRRVAVDIPSGLCADSGRVLGPDPEAVFHADLTISFHRAKVGHYLGDGPDICGALVVKDIGL